MNRFGTFLLGLFILIAIGFVWLASRDDSVSPPDHEEASQSPGALRIPVAGVRAEQLTDTFADARGVRTHGALDIMAPRGTPVIAAISGRVEKIFESEAGGHTVYIRSTNGRWIEYYAHLDAYADDLREGLPVGQGEVLGTVGSTGNASPAGPHLHFELKRMAPGEKWYEGTGINPYPLLARRVASR